MIWVRGESLHHFFFTFEKPTTNMSSISFEENHSDGKDLIPIDLNRFEKICKFNTGGSSRIYTVKEKGTNRIYTAKVFAMPRY